MPSRYLVLGFLAVLTQALAVRPIQSSPALSPVGVPVPGWAVALTSDTGVQCSGVVVAKESENAACRLVVATAAHCLGEASKASFGPDQVDANLPNNPMLTDTASTDLVYFGIPVSDCSKIAPSNYNRNGSVAAIGYFSSAGMFSRSPCVLGACPGGIHSSGGGLFDGQDNLVGVNSGGNMSATKVADIVNTPPIDPLMACLRQKRCALVREPPKGFDADTTRFKDKVVNKQNKDEQSKVKPKKDNP